MRILVAHNRYQYAGGEDAVVANEIAMLRTRGHDVLSVEADNSTIQGSLMTTRAASALFGSPDSSQSITRLLTDFPADIMHVHNWFPLLSPSVFGAATRARVPVVQTLHNFRMVCANGLLYRGGSTCRQCVGKAFPLAGAFHGCYRNSHMGSVVVTGAFAYHRAAGTWDDISRFIALSEFQRKLLVCGGIPDRQLTIKPNFVPDIGPVGTGQSGHFLFVGRLTPEKGIRTALRAWEEHALAAPLHIIGDGPLRDEVTCRAARSNRIRYLGPRSASEVATEVAGAIALVFPSEWYEPFALTVIEAFSHGTPVLACDIESNHSLIKHGCTGLIFPTGSSDELANRAAALNTDLAAYEAIRSRCRAEYVSRYTEAANYPLLMQIYQEAIGGKGAVQSSYRAQPQTQVAANAFSPQVANILGAPVHGVNMDAALKAIRSALACQRKGYICLAGAHGLIEARRDARLRRILARALMLLPDGMPTVWLGRLQGFAEMDRVFGPDLMLEVMSRSEFEQTRHFLWGGPPGLAENLRMDMKARLPHVKIVGVASPPFRDLSEQEITGLCEEIAFLKPDIIWVGVSTPKQDRLMAQFSPLLDTTLMIGVGAAFLFHTGLIRDSPKWIKLAGLQWLHRLIQEPSRLYRRYLWCVPLFAFHAVMQCSGLRRYPLFTNELSDGCVIGGQPLVRQP